MSRSVLNIKYALLTGVVLFAAFAIFCLLVLSQFDLIHSKQVDIQFEHNKTSLEGSLLLPQGNPPFPVVLFIHGDGPQDRFAGGSYPLLINTFLEKGIACFSWDKPGVGASGGNWLNQNMPERADEAIAALKALQNRDDLDHNNMGYIGFSQGGWVIPEIATKTKAPAFYVIVGGATNWQAQSLYITRTRLESEGFSNEEIQPVLSYARMENQFFLSSPSYEDYASFRQNHPAPKGYLTELMSEERFQFALNNIRADALPHLADIDKPLLAIWGEDDLNVDAQANYMAYKKIFAQPGHENATLRIFEDATHGLLDSKFYNYHSIHQWPLSIQARYLLEANNAYIEGYLPLLSDWVNNLHNKE